MRENIIMNMPEEQPPVRQEPITPEAVREAQKQTEATNIALMDKMEASVPENGGFFIKLGTKADQDGNTMDTRALILIVGMPTEPKKPKLTTESRLDAELNAIGVGTTALELPEFMIRKGPKQQIVLTRKGLKVMTLSDNDFERLLQLEANAKGGFSDGSNTIAWGESASHYTDLTNDEDGDNLFNEALTKSIEVSRRSSEDAKNKKALDETKQEQARAQRLAELSDKLIKPPVGEGPTRPPLISTE